MVCMRRSSKKLPSDANQRAEEIVRISTEELGRTPSVKDYLSRIGREGGLKGGKERALRLTASEKKAIATNAAKARWSKKKV
jgi:hypothetical protein